MRPMSVGRLLRGLIGPICPICPIRPIWVFLSQVQEILKQVQDFLNLLQGFRGLEAAFVLPGGGVVRDEADADAVELELGLHAG